MIFRGWMKTSLIEYPGKVATVLFARGCNFRCPFCYNRDLVLNPDKLVPTDEGTVLGYLEENRHLYRAVVVTGGEPTMDPGLPAFFSAVKKLGMLAGLETNGTNPGMLELMFKDGLLDFVAMDLKAPLDWDRYSRAAGITDKKLFESVTKSVEFLLRSGKDYEFRTTVVPGLHNEADILDLASEIRGAKKYALQAFIPGDAHVSPAYGKMHKTPAAGLERIGKQISGFFGAFEIRNV